jgi:hypothetical protein
MPECVNVDSLCRLIALQHGATDHTAAWAQFCGLSPANQLTGQTCEQFSGLRRLNFAADFISQSKFSSFSPANVNVLFWNRPPNAVIIMCHTWSAPWSSPNHKPFRFTSTSAAVVHTGSAGNRNVAFSMNTWNARNVPSPYTLCTVLTYCERMLSNETAETCRNSESLMTISVIIV